MTDDKNQIDIRVMTAGDIPFAKSLTDYENWAYRESDFKRLIAQEPDGCFVARLDDDPIGIITSTSYDDYAFVGTLIVKSGHRNKKTGERLLCRAMEYLESRGVTAIELDGVFEAVPLYRRLGFTDKYHSLRLFRPGQPEKITAELLEPDPTDEIIAFDSQQTGLNRAPLLERYLDEFKDTVYTLYENELAAYAFVRPNDAGSLIIGPCVAANQQGAAQLLENIIEGYAGKNLSLGVPEMNRETVELLSRRGFVLNTPSMRMYRGRRRDYEKHVVAILSPEKG